MHDDYPNYRSKLFIDANVILEGRPIRSLPWSEIDSEGPILVVVTPRVQSEVDSKKNDKRLGLRAREFNRLVAPLVSCDTPITIGDSSLQVDIVFAKCNQIDWASHDDLDRTESDDRIVAEILATQGISLEQKIVVSQDINPLIKAQRHGLRVRRVDTGWLPAPLPTPEATEIAQLRERLNLYSKSEPEFDADLSTDSANVTLFRVRELEQAESDSLKVKILARNPKPSQNRNGVVSSFYDDTLDGRYRHYLSETVPKFCAEFPNLLEIQFGQIPFKIRLQNTGQVRADHLSVTVRIVGGFFNSRPIALLAKGPPAPRVKNRLDSLNDAFNFPNAIKAMAMRVGRHQVDVAINDRVEAFTAECEDFQSGQTWRLDGVVFLDPHFGRRRTLLLEATAANFHGKFTKAVGLDVAVDDCNAFDLVSETSGDYLQEPVVRPLIFRALEEERYSDVEWIPPIPK